MRRALRLAARGRGRVSPNPMVGAVIVDDAGQIVGADNLSTGDAVREQHGRDESYHPSVPPDAVVYCTETDQVAAVVRACADRAVPVIPFGAGSSLEGQIHAPRGGISIRSIRLHIRSIRSSTYLAFNSNHTHH